MAFDPQTGNPSASLVATQIKPATAERPGSGSKWRTRTAYILLITYAILMFIPFAWTVITSFKTLPDSVRLTFLPQPFTTDAYSYVADNLVPPIQVMFWN